MTTKEIRALLYNIFYVEFKHNNMRKRYELKFNTIDKIFVYYNDNDPIVGSYFNIGVTKRNYFNILHILNNSSKYGFVSYVSPDIYVIQFVLYSGIKNIDI